MILLDTSVLLETFRVKDKTKTLFFRLSEKDNNFSISTITYYEILVGSNNTQTNYWNNFLRFITIIPFDTDCAIKAVDIYKDLKRQNKLIELSDLTIAATALAKGLPIATNNTKHFGRIEHLEIVK
ncbi:MAG: type II toxin-antitoxin system VapC family toxin [Prevotellaceae bacterium]|jgi:predicted nucleic acid-binding protein|nr:type II toxin-antitoxin system VapC family toxin [Prevotellaceae bacterium]